MPKGPLGGPRPFSDCTLKYRVKFEGATELETDPPLAQDVFDVRVSTPQKDALEFFIDEVGKVLLAVNFLAHPSKHRVTSFNIIEQTDDLTVWEAEYFLEGKGMGNFGRTVTGVKSIHNAFQVFFEGNNEPISSSSAIREFDSGPFTINSIQIIAE